MDFGPLDLGLRSVSLYPFPHFKAMDTRAAQNATGDKEPSGSQTRGRPEVIVEFLFDRGLLSISVNNIGDRPALNVSVKFSEPILGLAGTKDISELALFKNIEFLGPGREITTFLDRSSSYFGRKQPTRILARVSYTDPEKQAYEQTIKHDLEIYRDLAFVTPVTRGEEDL